MNKTFKYKKGEKIWYTSILGRWISGFIPKKYKRDVGDFFVLKRKIKIKLKG